MSRRLNIRNATDLFFKIYGKIPTFKELQQFMDNYHKPVEDDTIDETEEQVEKRLEIKMKRKRYFVTSKIK